MGFSHIHITMHFTLLSFLWPLWECWTVKQQIPIGHQWKVFPYMSGMAPGHSTQREHGNTLLGDFMARVPSSVNYPWSYPCFKQQAGLQTSRGPYDFCIFSSCLKYQIKVLPNNSEILFKTKCTWLFYYTYFRLQRKADISAFRGNQKFTFHFLSSFPGGLLSKSKDRSNRVLNIFRKWHRCRHLSRHEQRTS